LEVEALELIEVLISVTERVVVALRLSALEEGVRRCLNCRES